MFTELKSQHKNKRAHVEKTRISSNPKWKEFKRLNLDPMSKNILKDLSGDQIKSIRAKLIEMEKNLSK